MEPMSEDHSIITILLIKFLSKFGDLVTDKTLNNLCTRVLFRKEKNTSHYVNDAQKLAPHLMFTATM